ncbi:MAG: HAD superfamily hydrolase [Microgenomates bacterium 39_6]|nr:MAG: HAD superfamily hydrolase [Microgenomates bacterium 39_6]
MPKTKFENKLIKLVIFDLCGVLIDVAWQNMGQILKENKVGVSEDIFRKTSEEVFQLNKYTSIEYSVDIFLKRLNLQDNDTLRKTQISFINNWGEEAKPNVEAIALLNFAKKCGLKTAILSNVFPVKESWKKKWNIDTVDRFFFSYETGVLKPNKQAFLNVSQAFNISPNRCLVIGDSKKKEIAPANRLGMATIYWPNFLQKLPRP